MKDNAFIKFKLLCKSKIIITREKMFVFFSFSIILSKKVILICLLYVLIFCFVLLLLCSFRESNFFYQQSCSINSECPAIQILGVNNFKLRFQYQLVCIIRVRGHGLKTETGVRCLLSYIYVYHFSRRAPDFVQSESLFYNSSYPSALQYMLFQ